MCPSAIMLSIARAEKIWLRSMAAEDPSSAGEDVEEAWALACRVDVADEEEHKEFNSDE